MMMVSRAARCACNSGRAQPTLRLTQPCGRSQMSIFFVYINRQGIPKKRHKSIESARAEALRLHTATEGRRAVYVLGVLETLAALPQPDPSPEISSKTGREILRLKKSD